MIFGILSSDGQKRVIPLDHDQAFVVALIAQEGFKDRKGRRGLTKHKFAELCWQSGLDPSMFDRVLTGFRQSRVFASGNPKVYRLSKTGEAIAQVVLRGRVQVRFPEAAGGGRLTQDDLTDHEIPILVTLAAILRLSTHIPVNKHASLFEVSEESVAARMVELGSPDATSGIEVAEAYGLFFRHEGRFYAVDPGVQAGRVGIPELGIELELEEMGDISLASEED